MQTKKLEIKNFNGRTYQLQTYTVKSSHAPLNKLRPLAIVVPGGLSARPTTWLTKLNTRKSMAMMGTRSGQTPRFWAIL